MVMEVKSMVKKVWTLFFNCGSKMLNKFCVLKNTLDKTNKIANTILCIGYYTFMC